MKNFVFFPGIIAYIAPCYIIGKNAEAVGDSCCLCGCAHFFAPFNLWSRVLVRGKIREQKGINVSNGSAGQTRANQSIFLFFRAPALLTAV